MNLKELEQQFRELADDKVAPYLWSKKLVIGYANEAENEACRRARLLVDSSTPEITRIAISIGKTWLTLDPRVIFVRRFMITDRSDPVRPVRRQDLDNCYPGWEDETGELCGYVPDMETGKLRLFRLTDTAVTARLTVIREPLEPMEDPDDTPEIAARYHFNLIEWMLHRAYSKQDTQAYDPERAARHLAVFEAEFGKRSSAIDEQWQHQQYGMDDFEGLF